MGWRCLSRRAPPARPSALRCRLVRTETVIEGLAGPLVIARNEFTGRYSVSVGGQAVAGGRNREYQLPTRDGGTVAARIHRPKLLDPFPTFEVAGVPYRTGPRVPAGLMVLALAPLVLVGFGGLLGGLVAALGIVANLRVARGAQPAAVKVGVMAAVLVATAVTWLILAALLRAAVSSA
jgi:hypothetical protein